MNYDPGNPLNLPRMPGWQDYEPGRVFDDSDEVRRYFERQRRIQGGSIASTPHTTGYVAAAILNPQKGEVWFIEDPKTNLLVKAKIEDVTASTIEVDVFAGSVFSGRYRKGHLRFVERYLAAPAEPQEDDNGQ